jgi:tetratricopeptide (TPR) repeat protein
MRIQTKHIPLALIFAAALFPAGGLHGQQTIAQQEVALVQQAGKYFQAKDYANAIQTYNSAIKLNPKFAAPYSGLGDVYMAQGQYQMAVTAYKQWFVLGALDPVILVVLSDTYAPLGQYDQAITAYQKATANLPPYQYLAAGQLYQRIGDAYAFEKQYANAIDALQKSLQSYSPNDSATYDLGVAYAAAEQKTEAIQIYQELLSSNADLAQKFYNQIYGANAAKSAPAQPDNPHPKPATNRKPWQQHLYRPSTDLLSPKRGNVFSLGFR